MLVGQARALIDLCPFHDW